MAATPGPSPRSASSSPTARAAGVSRSFASALCKVDRAVKSAYDDRADYAWPREAQLSLLHALATRLERGRVPAKS